MNEDDIMKKYATMDIETYAVKEIDMSEWEEVEDEEVTWTPRAKERPFSYDNMLTSVMEYLESVGGVEFAVMKDPELGRWWNKKVHKRDQERKLKEAKEKLYSTMSKEELKILGIKV